VSSCTATLLLQRALKFFDIIKAVEEESGVFYVMSIEKAGLLNQ
jgi:hypothetical protein